MFTSIGEFCQTWQRESNATRRLMNALTDASLDQPVAKDHRTLGRIAWHIVLTIPEMAAAIGLKASGPPSDAPLPASAREIRAAYDLAASSLLEQISTNWDDDTLLVEDELYGERWPRGLTLRILLDHEIHHRGQMSVLMRQAGLVVPGIYGPALEEWSQYGTTPPEI